jgi:predicted nucleic acid-binding protein
VSVFVDTAVIMYAGGRDHRLREPCTSLLRAIVAGEIEGATSAEVVQEILHRFTASGARAIGAAMAEATLDIFAPVLPITEGVMRRMPALVLEYPAMAARDLVHVATCREAGIDLIVSPDRGFDTIDGLARIDPVDAPARLL